MISILVTDKDPCAHDYPIDHNFVVSERTTARTLLRAIERIEDTVSDPRWQDRIEIDGTVVTPGFLHEFAGVMLGHRDGCRTIKACRHVLEHVGRKDALKPIHS